MPISLARQRFTAWRIADRARERAAARGAARERPPSALQRIGVGFRPRTGEGGIVYYGQAAEIRRALGEHLRGRACSGQRVSGCSWEVAADPEGRHRDLLRGYAAAHRSLPLWNDPQRLPTD